jgi:phosphate butyryltransferase
MARQVVDDDSLPELMLPRHRHVEQLLASCASLPAMPTVVVAPEDKSSLRRLIGAEACRQTNGRRAK